MNITNENLFFAVIAFIFLFFFPAPSPAAQKNTSITLSTGFCCYKGSVTASSALACKQKGGEYYTTNAAAQQNCPGKSYCCLNGKVSELSAAQCRKSNGIPYTSKAEAQEKCKPAAVYCCAQGKVIKVSAKECKRQNGSVYKTASEAKRKCLPVVVYCCVQGKVEKLSAGECKRQNGSVYKTASEAKRKCQPPAVYCCLKGDVKKLSAGECKKRKGKPYNKQREAKENCGWCCSENLIFPSSPDECQKKRGKYFFSKPEADRRCRELPQCCIKGQLLDYEKLECERKKGKYYRSPDLAKRMCGVGKKQLPYKRIPGNLDGKKSIQPRNTPKQIMRTPSGMADIIARHEVDPEMRTMSLDEGINIFTITEITSYSFIMRYAVDSSLDNGDITFAMFHGGEKVAEIVRPFTYGGRETTARVDVGQNFTWSLPADLVNGDNYSIIATKSDALGASGIFSVNLPYRPYATGMGMSIDFEHTDRTYFFHGQEISLRIASTCGDPIDEINLQLITGGVGADGTSVHEFPVVDTGGAFLIMHVPWTIPSHIAEGEYRLFARAGVSHCIGFESPSAVSRVFTINPPPSDETPADRNTLSIRSPAAGDTVYTGDYSQLWTQWTCVHCTEPDDISFTRVLLKNRAELQRVGPIHAGGDMTPMEFFNIFGYLSGDDYQVRIELNRWNYDTERAEMIASETTGNFSIVNNSMTYHADTNPVLLRTPSGFGGATYAIGSTLEIMWSHSPPRSTVDNVRLTLTRESTEGGGEWVIARRIPAFPSTRDWVIPSDVPPGPGYRVLIERVDGAGMSNSYIPFTITP